MKEHTWYKCAEDCNGCQFCEGGLGACTVCGGAEGTLSIECCGFPLDEHVQKAIYSGGLDYAGGTWHVAPQEVTRNWQRMLNWREGLKVHSKATKSKCICQGFYVPHNCPIHGHKK